jgi:hypothetical protein
MGLVAVGDASLAGGDAAGGQAGYAQALTLERAFAAAHPGPGPAANVAAIMAKLAAIPGGSVRWSDVVAYLEGLKAKNLWLADDQEWLDIYRQRAGQEAAK